MCKSTKWVGLLLAYYVTQNIKSMPYEVVDESSSKGGNFRFHGIDVSDYNNIIGRVIYYLF